MRSIIRRVSTLTVELEALEHRFALANEAGETAKYSDLDLYIRGAGRLQHLLEAIGLDRKARPIGSNVVNTINGKPPQVFSPLRERLLDTVIEVPAGAAE